MTGISATGSDDRRQNVERLIFAPTESLNIELKTWIDPTSPEGIEKIARGVISLYNRNGGYFLIGFNDKTLLPELPEFQDVGARYHLDVLQVIVSRYSSVPIEIHVDFVDREHVAYPVLTVPSGVRTPAAIKAPLGKARVGDVLFRTLRAGGVVSTAVARPDDWADIMNICFDNRDADMGTFIRRHLSGLDVERLAAVLAEARAPKPTSLEHARALLEAGAKRFTARLGSTSVAPLSQDWGGVETAVVIDPPLDQAVADRDLLRTVAVATPGSNGVLWYETRGIGEDASPKWLDNGWESFVFRTGGFIDALDFMRIEPQGALYQRRLHVTDSIAAHNGTTPGKLLDPRLVIQDVAETIATGLAIATAFKCEPDQTSLAFCFRWTGLKDRLLHDLTGQLFPRDMSKSEVEEARGEVQVPLTAAPLAVAPYALTATRRLFASFGGFTLSLAEAEPRIRARLERGG
jgi:hypothetical protein